MSYAIKGSIMGATVGAGMSKLITLGSANDVDPSFVTVGYSIAGLNRLWFMTVTTVVKKLKGVGTSVAGMNAGVTFASADKTTDVDYMKYLYQKVWVLHLSV